MSHSKRAVQVVIWMGRAIGSIATVVLGQLNSIMLRLLS